MKRVILESPYAANSAWFAFIQRWINRRYARRCVRDALLRGEAPIASHLLYTQPGILRDHDPAERQWGIDAGLAWRAVADASVVYVDRGISRGMRYGIAAAQRAGLPVEYRKINLWDVIEADTLAGLELAPRVDPIVASYRRRAQHRRETLAHGKTRSEHAGPSA